MVALKMGVWWVVAILLLSTSCTHCRNVTHEDIRDAMLSLVHMFRTSEDKLERHEYREKSLGDQLKKMLAGIDKRQRGFDPLKGMISRLDDRLSNVETILLQKEEREKITQKKTNDALEGMQKTLRSLTDSLNDASKQNNVMPVVDPMCQTVDKINVKLDALEKEMTNLKNSLSQDSLRAMCLNMASDVNPLEKHISETEKLLNKYETKLNEYNENATKIQTDFVPLSEVALADEAWHSKMTEVMERQEKEIKKIHHILSDAESMWKALPKTTDLETYANQTLSAVEALRNTVQESDTKSSGDIVTKIREMSDRLATTNQDIQNSLTQSNTMTERAYNDIARNYETLKIEVQTLTKNEHVMLETADNVMSTKKRVDYAVHQILHDVGGLIKTQERNLNKTISERFNTIESTLVDSQTQALTNLSTKVESQMSQIWRQIGIMYAQMTASKLSLDKLVEQSEQYVNGTTATLDSMKNKVGLLTTFTTKMEEDLKYLIGRMSLLTQEFTHVKTELGDTLEKVKTSLAQLRSKVKDGGIDPSYSTNAEINSVTN